MNLNFNKGQSMKKILNLVAIASIISSCAMIQKMACNSGSAKSAGSKDASNGVLDGKAAAASFCDGAEYSSSQYSADYQMGFDERKNQMCQAGEMAKLAKADGLNGVNKADVLKKYRTCESMNNYKSLISTYEKAYHDGMCSDERAKKLGVEEGQKLIDSNKNIHFVDCKTNERSLILSYENSYQQAYKNALLAKEKEFQNTTGTTVFNVQNNNLTAICNISNDKSFMKVTVTNNSPNKFLLQGSWNYQYFDKSFNKITDDSSSEALLLTSKTTKSFTKMTLPKDANFCRAEFVNNEIVK